MSASTPSASTVLEEFEALDPINEIVDSDALTNIFQPQGGDQHPEGCVRFVYENHRVTVYANQTIEFCPLDDTTSTDTGNA
jgi:hypothetical protein